MIVFQQITLASGEKMLTTITATNTPVGSLAKRAHATVATPKAPSSRVSSHTEPSRGASQA